MGGFNRFVHSAGPGLVVGGGLQLIVTQGARGHRGAGVHGGAGGQRHGKGQLQK